MAIQIFEKDSNRFVCEISEADLAILVGHLEEESSRDQDYFIEQTAVEALEQLGASSGFVTALRNLVGETEGADVKWVRS